MNVSANFWLILFCLLTASTFLIYWHFRAQLNKDYIEVAVGIATILTGLASIMVGIVSVKVMNSQNDMQKKLIEYQKKEHQPTFIVKKSLAKSSPDQDQYDYEEYSLSNIGERVKSIQSVDVKTFVKVTYSLLEENRKIVSYIPLTYYYNATVLTGDVQDEIQYSVASDKIKNNEYYSKVYFEAIEYSKQMEGEYLLIDKIQFFVIAYTDIYDEQHTLYLKGKEVVDESCYSRIKEAADEDYENKRYNLSELKLSVFWDDCKQLKRDSGLK